MQIENLVGEKNQIFGQAKAMNGVRSVESGSEKSMQVERDGSVQSAVSLKEVTYLNPAKNGEVTKESIMDEASVIDATAKKNQMVVSKNTVSAKDAKQMDEEGFSLHDMEGEAIVTETDKIKMQLAKAGVDTSFMGDALTDAQLEAMGGTAAVSQVTHALEQADLPVNRENVKDMTDALALAEGIQSLSTDAIHYLVQEQFAPTIENLYKAQYMSTASKYASSGQNHGYAGAESVSSWDSAEMTKQILDLFANAGISNTKENLSVAKELIQEGLPVTAENVDYYKQLESLSLPLEKEALLSDMTDAIREGKRPKDATPIAGHSLMSQAKEIQDTLEAVTEEDLKYVVSNGQEVTLENLRNAHEALEESGSLKSQYHSMELTVELSITYVTARRNLEEVRLSMTLEATFQMLKLGVEVDTTPIEDFINQLKEVENNFYKNQLSSETQVATDAQVTLYSHVMTYTMELRQMPMVAIGSAEFDGHTLESLHAVGSSLQKEFEAAGKSYEAMMTEIRKDLGDNIKDAFRSVDGILEDMGMEPSEENRRAIRMLSYNRVDVTMENVARMKEADSKVQTALSHMKPAVVTEMIKEGINPLTMDMDELNAKAKELEQTLGVADDTERFSRYLWQLEHDEAITAEQRESYIGIYRLIHQVEASDGAAIGAVIEQGGSLTMENLLKAVRSEKKTGAIDKKIDDSFGTLDENRTGGIINSITEQIESAFAAVEAIEKNVPLDYYQEQLDEMAKASEAPQAVFEQLMEYGIPVTTNHVNAMQQMMANPNDMMRKFFGIEPEDVSDDEDLMAEIENIKAGILRQFGESLKTPEDLARAQEQLAEMAEKCSQGYIFSEGTSYLDLKQMQLMTKQMAISAQMAKEEHYHIPVLVGDGVANVSVKIVRSTEEKGWVSVAMESDLYGELTARLHATKKAITGYVASSTRAGAELLHASKDALSQSFAQIEGEEREVSLDVLYLSDLNKDGQWMMGQDGQETVDKDNQVQTRMLYAVAEKMVQFLGSTSK